MNSHIDLYLGKVNNSSEGISGLTRLLSPHELKRARTYRLKHDSNRYVFAHAMLRKAIGKLVATPPELLKISTDTYGKPFLEHRSNIKFSLSYANDLLAIALSHHREIGVDIEKKAAINNIDTLVEKFMSRQERFIYKIQKPADRLDYFYRCWVRKESVVKAWGKGIDEAFCDLNVMDDAGVHAKKKKILYKGDEKKAWILMDIELYNDYFGAICSEGKNIQINMHNLDSIW
jgi:4'-phosphopantetheinyl transferase